MSWKLTSSPEPPASHLFTSPGSSPSVRATNVNLPAAEQAGKYDKALPGSVMNLGCDSVDDAPPRAIPPERRSVPNRRLFRQSVPLWVENSFFSPHTFRLLPQFFIHAGA